MRTKRARVTKEHKAMLAIESLHAIVVSLILVLASALYLVHPQGFPSDLLGFVYSGGIGYVGGRAGVSRGVLKRQGDTAPDDNEA